MRFLFAVVIMFFTSITHAANRFEELELLSYQTSSAFNAFIYYEGQEQEHLQQAKRYLAKGHVLTNNIEGDTAELAKLWQQADDFIAEHSSESAVGIDGGRDANWMLITQQINKILSKVNQEYSSEQIRLQVEMEKTLSMYMQYINSPVGGYSVLQSEITIDERVQTVSELLEKNSAINKRLRRKWGYIKKTLLAYNSNAAPFIILRVYEDMRKIFRA